jgi:sugar O-acyltransferase (sialic acid O-acetyltransferase NeuD family)
MKRKQQSWLGIVGTGGFARETLYVALDRVRADPQIGVADDHVVFVDLQAKPPLNGFAVMSQDDFLALDGDRWFSVAVGDGHARKRIAETLEAAGCRPLSIQAHNVLIPPNCEIGSGAVFSPFSMVTADAVIGRQFQCNIYSYVAHDCVIGDYVTLAPHVCLNGNVHVEDFAYIGTGASIRQGTPERPLRIGRGAIIGMGAVVTRDVAEGTTVVGNPARPMEPR